MTYLSHQLQFDKNERNRLNQQNRQKKLESTKFDKVVKNQPTIMKSTQMNVNRRNQ